MVASTVPKKASLSSNHDNSVSSSPKHTEIIRNLLEGRNKGYFSANFVRIKDPSSYTIDLDIIGTTTKAASESSSTTSRRRQLSPKLNPWRDYEVLRDTNLEDNVLSRFFLQSGLKRQSIIANRFLQVYTTCTKARDDWNQAQERKRLRAKSDPNYVAAPEVNAGDMLRMPTTDDPDAVKLCEAVASLGPLAVKLGQTLSQRPDIVGKEACVALKRLQTQNTPFSNDLAHAVLRESLGYWDGPLAANLNETEWNIDGDNDASQHQPLFRYLSQDPIASASLGQVYKATTWEGQDIALKIQRPDALSVLAIDAQCFRIASAVRTTWIDGIEKCNAFLGKTDDLDNFEHTPENGMTEEEVRAQGPDGTIGAVIDRVARDILRELDFRIEAENSYKFRDSLSFLGFVDTPDVLLATDKVLVTQFVNGDHLQNLDNPKHGLALTRMAVEACTASMVLTGFVHADPHEGNLMYREEDGRIVFLDFGLMSDVEQNVMEAFARGIQAMLSEDFVSVTKAWADTGFVTTPVMHRNSLEDLWKVDPNFGLDELAQDMEHYTKTTEGGLSRFGALATVLNKKISPNWLVFTPPYVLLLIRTFLTLEGIAGQVDPDFNIYEMSMPWVVRRSLSPSTEEGRRVLRNTILKEDNTIQWERILELMEIQKATAAASEEEDDNINDNIVDAEAATAMATTSTENEASGATKTAAIPAARSAEEKERKQKEFAAARQGAMKDAIGTLLGSTNGRALRGVLTDLDTPDLIWKLGSKEGRPILKFGTESALKSLFGKIDVAAKPSSLENDSQSVADTENYRPMSEECQQLRAKQAKRTKQVTRFLLKKHVKKCLLGAKGLLGVSRLVLATLQITLAMAFRSTIHKMATLLLFRTKVGNSAASTMIAAEQASS